MAVPIAYTEDELKAYMHAALGATAGVLGWSVDAEDYDEAVISTLLIYGVSDIVNATDIRKLRTLAKREALRKAYTETLTDFTFSADGGSYSRGQVNAQIKAALDQVEIEASTYDDTYAVEMAEISWDYSPYTPEED